MKTSLTNINVDNAFRLRTGPGGFHAIRDSADGCTARPFWLKNEFEKALETTISNKYNHTIMSTMEELEEIRRRC